MGASTHNVTAQSIAERDRGSVMASLAPDLDTLPVHEWPHFDGLVLAAVREGGGSALTVARRLGDELNVADPAAEVCHGRVVASQACGEGSAVHTLRMVGGGDLMAREEPAPQTPIVHLVFNDEGEEPRLVEVHASLLGATQARDRLNGPYRAAVLAAWGGQEPPNSSDWPHYIGELEVKP